MITLPPSIEIGKRFRKLEVIYVTPCKGGFGLTLKCDCGNIFHAESWKFSNGAITSCKIGGCKSGKKRKHGHSDQLIYKIWTGIKQRCLNPKNPAFRHYGERGISVCNRWMRFENFLADIGERPSLSHTVERVDNNKGYSPNNCKWATRKEQSNNTRRNKICEIGDTRKTLSEWTKQVGINQQSVRGRLQHGWNFERALYEPISIKFRNGRAKNCKRGISS